MTPSTLGFLFLLTLVGDSPTETTLGKVLKRAALLGDVQVKLKAKDARAFRAAADTFLDTYTEDTRYSGRSTLINVLYEAKATEEMLALVREWRGAKVRFDEREALTVVATLYEADKNWDRAAGVYGEMMWIDAVRRDWVQLRLASRYKAAGDEKKLLPLLKELKELAEAKWDIDPDTVGWRVHPENSNNARKLLADYYFEKKEWKEAMKWYQAWVPGLMLWGGCGVGLSGIDDWKRGRIAECRKQLDLKP